MKMNSALTRPGQPLGEEVARTVDALPGFRKSFLSGYSGYSGYFEVRGMDNCNVFGNAVYARCAVERPAASMLNTSLHGTPQTGGEGMSAVPSTSQQWQPTMPPTLTEAGGMNNCNSLGNTAYDRVGLKRPAASMLNTSFHGTPQTGGEGMSAVPSTSQQWQPTMPHTLTEAGGMNNYNSLGNTAYDRVGLKRPAASMLNTSFHGTPQTGGEGMSAVPSTSQQWQPTMPHTLTEAGGMNNCNSLGNTAYDRVGLKRPAASMLNTSFHGTPQTGGEGMSAVPSTSQQWQQSTPYNVPSHPVHLSHPHWQSPQNATPLPQSAPLFQGITFPESTALPESIVVSESIAVSESMAVPQSDACRPTSAKRLKTDAGAVSPSPSASSNPDSTSSLTEDYKKSEEYLKKRRNNNLSAQKSREKRKELELKAQEACKNGVIRVYGLRTEVHKSNLIIDMFKKIMARKRWDQHWTSTVMNQGTTWQQPQLPPPPQGPYSPAGVSASAQSFL